MTFKTESVPNVKISSKFSLMFKVVLIRTIESPKFDLFSILVPIHLNLVRSLFSIAKHQNLINKI